MLDGIFFFFFKKKLTIGFFGVKFTADYRDVAKISSLFPDHIQNSKNPNFLIFFSTFDRDPEIIM